MVLMSYKNPYLLALAMGPAMSLAQPASPVEQLLVTGTYTSTPMTELTSSVSVLELETIESLSKRTIADLLKTVPGLLVEEQGGPGGWTAVSIRGGESNFTLVMVDGVLMNDPTNSRGGGFDFSNLDIANVERIEIVRGPQSAVYGSDAVAGVINIITRRGEQGYQQRLRAQRGEEDFSNYSASTTGTAGDLSYALGLARRDGGDAVEGSSRDTDEANIRLDWSGLAAHSFSLGYRYLDGSRTSFPEQSGGPLYARSDALDMSDYRDQTLFASWRAELSPAWSSKVSFSQFEHEEDYRSPGISPFFAVPPNGADTEFERRQLQWINHVVFAETSKLNIGADFRREEGGSTGYLDLGFMQLPTDFELDRNTTGLFADLHVQLTPALLLQGGLRYDDPEGFSSKSSLSFGVRYQVLPGTTVSANWGEGYKLPSFFALGHALVGNPELKPETSEGWDLGLSWTDGESVHLSASYFYNDHQDLVDFDAELFRNVNRQQVKTQGLELQFDWNVLPGIQLLAHTTYTDIDVKSDESVLTGRPEWRAGATALWQVQRDWHTSIDYQWTGEQFASSLHTGETVFEELDDYHRVDWNLHWQAAEMLRVEFALDNVLDEEYETAVGFPALGRTARLGFSIEWD